MTSTLIRPSAREDRPLVNIDACRNPQRLALGVRLYEQGRYEKAARVFSSLDKPGRPHYEARYFYALCLNDAGDTARAATLMESVVRARPQFVGALYNLGYLYDRLGRRHEAEVCYRRTLVLEPAFVSAWLNLGNTLVGRGAWEEGARAYQHALRLAPQNPQALVNLAHTRLLLGDYQQGWRLYHERWNLPAFRALNGLSAPNAGRGWRGEDIRGQRLVVFREQGTGDVIQMLRYDPILREMGAQVIWRVPAHLFRLAAHSLPHSTVVTDAERLPDHDCIVPAMSLPLFCGTSSLQNIPGADGYLCVDLPTLRRAEFTVGVAWAGSAAHKRDRERSLGIEAMAPLFTVPSVRFINLQFGPREHEGDAYGLARVDVSDYFDTARLLRTLDLVIAVDTSVVHLAGAMRVPCWVCVTAVPDFRWLVGRTDSPWYRSVALYRQPVAGDWTSVIAEVQDHLTLVSQRRSAA